MTRTIVAIDGPAGAGKSTVAKMIASKLGLAYVDTGATYRLVALRALRDGLPLDDAGALALLARQTMERCALDSGTSLTFEGTRVGPEIRTPEVSEATSIISQHPQVRDVLVEFQRRLVPPRGAVVEGRDIGAVVWPDADVKVYLDAHADVRAGRRASDLGTSEGATIEVHERDERDATRAVSAMQPAPGAVVLDTTSLAPDDVAARILDLLPATRSAGSRKAEPARRRIDLFYRTIRGLVTLLLRGPFRMEVRGREHIPSAGPAILAPNHRSLIDIPVAAAITRRKVWFMAKEELFGSSIGGRTITRLGAFPVRRGRPDRSALNRSLELLRQGEVVGIFPEGTRSPGSRFDNLEEGFAYIALKSGAPIVPVAISGTESVFPPRKRFPRFVKIRVLIGEPFTLTGASPASGVLPRSRIREATEQARERLAAVMDTIEPRPRA